MLVPSLSSILYSLKDSSLANKCFMLPYLQCQAECLLKRALTLCSSTRNPITLLSLCLPSSSFCQLYVVFLLFSWTTQWSYFTMYYAWWIMSLQFGVLKQKSNCFVMLCFVVVMYCIEKENYMHFKRIINIYIFDFKFYYNLKKSPLAKSFRFNKVTYNKLH